MPERPDILLIMTDQHRHDLCGFTGSDLVRTPQLDRLAAGGTVLNEARTPIPLCMPARSCLMTGRYGSAIGLLDNQLILGPEVETLPGVLAEHGYRRALFGKNHCFKPEALLNWDACEVYEMHGKDPVLSRTPPTPADKVVTHWRKTAVPYFEAAVYEPQPGGEAAEPAVRQTDEALAFLRQSDSEPFFMYLSFEAPHFPYVLPEPYFSRSRPEKMPGSQNAADPSSLHPARLRAQWYGLALDKTSEADIRRVQASYISMLELVDEQIGRVISALRQSEKLTNTLIVFCSDHGDFFGRRGFIGKSTVLFESLLRVPLMLHGPGVPTGRCDAPFDLCDLAPTLLELAGLPPLKMAQGRSLAPLLRGEQAQRRRYLVAEHAFGRTEGFSETEVDALIARRELFRRAGDPFWFLDALRGSTRSVHDTETGWKLITHDQDEPELYHLGRDPLELHNRFSEQPLEAQRLAAVLEHINLADPDVFERLAAL